MGLGRFGGGAGAARWLAQQGAQVTVTDLADEASLPDSLASLANVPIAAFHLGGHREDDFRWARMVVVNPAVHPDNPLVALAAASGARIVTEIELFMEHCPGRLVGVTGSNGKSTTAAMIAAILQADGRRTWLGGNLGGSLLERLDAMQSDDWIVLELSSFQLSYLGPESRVPEVAIVTNCTPNHLNWHPDFAHYVAAKQRLLTGQQTSDLAVLNVSDPEVASWTPLVRGRLLPPLPIDQVPPLGVPGHHNQVNAACAGAAALGIGCAMESVRRGLELFVGLPQRLEMFAVVGGRKFYNDSSATTPESTIAALNALDEPVWLLAGGSDKGVDLSAMGDTIAARTVGAAFYGAVRESLRRAVAAHPNKVRCATVATLAEALEWCWQRSRPGESIVLSPGCASLDQFTNYRHRGETFVELVRALARRSDRPGLPASGGR
jgi:UDP-N-acetylmuramoylalanine--D-glutamate ligase